MSMTSITSTRGVVLISDIGFSSSKPSPEDTFMLMVEAVSGGYWGPSARLLLDAAGDDLGARAFDARTADDHLLEVVREELDAVSMICLLRPSRKL